MSLKSLSRPFFVLFTALMLWAQPSVYAQDTEHSDSSTGFNAKETIMGHIIDAHEIHIVGDFVIYLPVIAYTDNGLKVFSSSNFYKNPKTFAGADVVEKTYYAYDGLIMVDEKIYHESSQNVINIDSETGAVLNKAVLDFSITKTVVGLFLASILLVWLFTVAARGYKKRQNSAPKGLQSFLEPLVIFIKDEVIVPAIGEKKAERYMPFMLTIFFFIWIANILGLIPFIGGFNITGTLSVTLVLAAIVFLVVTFSGNKHYWGHILWPPGVPFPVKIILVPIEFIGILIKPTVLMIRLTANITAGHIIMLAFVVLIFIFGESMGAGAGYGVGVGSVLFMVFMFFLELLVAFLQAYVFTLLAAIYIGDAVREPHH